MTIKELCETAHAASRAGGWYDFNDGERNIPEMLCLVHSEVSEALEDVRNDNMVTKLRDDGKPEGFGSELADIMIRVGDLAGYLGINLEEEIRIKMAHNKTRAYRHNGKKC